MREFSVDPPFEAAGVMISPMADNLVVLVSYAVNSASLTY
jgi:hypothetical protein